MDDKTNRCRWCREDIVSDGGVWSSGAGQICPESGEEHAPYKVTVLPPVEAWDTNDPARISDRSSRKFAVGGRDASQVANRRTRKTGRQR